MAIPQGKKLGARLRVSIKKGVYVNIRGSKEELSS